MSQSLSHRRRFNDGRACSLALLLWASLSGGRLVAAEPALKAPAGFSVNLFADDDLAHDIHCMTIDARGRITVAGNGFIKLLIDSDGDGLADKAELFAEGPAIRRTGNVLARLRFAGRRRRRSAEIPRPRWRRQGGWSARCAAQAQVRRRASCALDPARSRWLVVFDRRQRFAGVDSKYVTLPNAPIKQPASGCACSVSSQISAVVRLSLTGCETPTTSLSIAWPIPSRSTAMTNEMSRCRGIGRRA